MSLVVGGIALIVLFLVLVGLARSVGNTTKATSPSAMATPTASSSTTGATPGAATAAQTITTTTKAWPSDSLLTTLLATGAALVVIGLFYSRISVVKLPGGAEIDLTDGEKQKIKDKVKEDVKANRISQADSSVVEAKTRDTLRAIKGSRGTLQAPEASDSEVEAALNVARQFVV